jgi:uncharacterized membrane protein
MTDAAHSHLPVRTDAKTGINLHKIWLVFRRYAWAVLVLLIVLTALYVILITNVIAEGMMNDKAMSGVQIFESTFLNNLVLFIHAVTAIVALAIGPVAFSAKRRKASIKEHRVLGQAYVIGIWISGATGVMLAAYNTHGPVAQFGFGTLGVLWLLTTTLAYKTARAKKIVEHRRWMIRSYALTLAVVTVRPLFFFPPPESVIPYEQWYLMVTWLCWVPNLIIAEIFVQATTFKNDLKFAPPQKARR